MQIAHFVKSCWYATSWADTSLFPLPALAGAQQGPPQGQARFEFTNAVGGRDGEGMKEA